MLTIRREQLEALRKVDVKRFEREMMQHLRSRFRPQVSTLSDDELENLIQNAVVRAASHDVTLEGDVRRFLECVAIYGIDFDVNPQHAWAGKILCHDDSDGTTKMNMIADYEVSFLRR
jgi:hypothetical protein